MKILRRNKSLFAVLWMLTLCITSIFGHKTSVYAVDFTRDSEGNLLAEDEQKFYYMVPAGQESAGECMLYVYGGNQVNLVLPKKCNSYQVTTVSKDFTSMIPYLGYGQKSLETVKIPSGYRIIEDGDGGRSGAFQNQTELYCIEIPKSVTKIGDKAFDGCDKSKLTFVTPKGSYARLYAIEKGIFYTDSKKVGVNTFGTTMVVGETKQIAVYNSKKPAKFQSSDSSIVSVSKTGELTAKKAGTAKLTVKVSGKKYSYTITVKKRTKSNVLNVIWSNYVTKDMTDDEKVAAAKHWLDRNVKVAGSQKTSKAALVKGKASKAGYDKAFIEILEHYGL